jgi:hypothetical protein
MAWHKIIDNTTGEIQIVAGLEGIDTDAHTCIAIMEDRPPVGLEQVAEDGTIYVPLADLQASVWEAVKALREEKLLLAPVTIAGTDYVAQSDLASMVKINGLVSMATIAKSLGAPYAEVFTMADNSEVELDADQMIGFGIQVGTYIASVHARAREFRALIYAEDATRLSVECIDIGTGWPS